LFPEGGDGEETVPSTVHLETIEEGFDGPEGAQGAASAGAPRPAGEGVADPAAWDAGPSLLETPGGPERWTAFWSFWSTARLRVRSRRQAATR
jgi:hypothetical protein